MTGLGKYSVDVYICNDDVKLQKLSPVDHGHFFNNHVYLVDVKGEKHRYLLQWFGQRLPSDK